MAYSFSPIAGQAAAAHPSWAPAKPQKPPSIAGQALAGHPNWGIPKPPKINSGLSAAGSAATNLAGGLAGQTPPAPTAQAGGQNAPGPADAGSGLDSTALGNIAAFLFKTNNSINADQAKEGNLDTSLQSTLGQLNYQQPRDQLRLEQQANQGGGLFSSVYGQNLGNLGQKYLTSRTNAQTSHDQQYGALAAAIAALQGSIPLYENSEAEASAQRAAAAAQANPALGAPTPPPAAPAPTAPAAPTVAQQLQQDQQRAQQQQNQNRDRQLAQQLAKKGKK